METNSIQATSVCREYWIKNSWMPNRWLQVSTIGENPDAPWHNPEPEPEDKLLAIIKERICSTRSTLVSVVVDKPDFLPLSFLQDGAKLSLAVCRIVRNFSLTDFKKLVKEIEALKDISNFNSIEKLKEIFSIPDRVADEIFKQRLLTEPLKHLFQLSEEQLAKLNPIPIGTGFLVGGTHLLTNHHVIPDQKTAEQCIAQFNYIDDVIGSQPIDYEFAPQVLFASNPDLDYTLIQLKSEMFTMPAGYKFSWIQLVEDDENIACSLDRVQTEKLIDNTGFTDKQLKSQGLTQERTLLGDKVIIVQHPKGKGKQITLTNNTVKGLYKNFLRYTADSDYGSSGSPVFNKKWELVALHHAAIAEVLENSDCTIIAQQGVRICQIIKDLKKKSLTNTKLESFIEDFVVTSEELNYPPLPSAIEFDGKSSYVDLGDHKSLETTEAITFEIWIKPKYLAQDRIIINRFGDYSLSWEMGRIWLKRLRAYKQEKSKSEIDITFTNKVIFKDDLWHHVAFTGRWGEKVKIYIDGEEQDISNHWAYASSEILYLVEQAKYLSQGHSKNLYIGGIPNEKYCVYNPENYFSGSITEVRLWGIVRDRTEIINYMHRRLNPEDRNGLKGYWQFDESESYRIYNLTTNSLSSPLSGEKFTPQLQFGLQLDGLNDYIDCGNLDSLKIENTITVEAWIRNDGNTKDGMIVNRGGSWYEPGYGMWQYGGKIRVEISDGKIVALADAPIPQKFIDENSWYHIAFTMEPLLKKIKIYINGIEENITQQIYKRGISFPANDAPFECSIGQPRVNLNIGFAQNYGYFFQGSIAEVRLWNVARSGEQIKANMSCMLDIEQANMLDIEQAKKAGLIGYWRLNETEGNKAKNLASEDEDGVVYGGKWLKPYRLLTANQGAYGVTFRTKRLRASQYPALPLPFGLQFQEKSDRVDCGKDNLSTPAAITVEAWVKHKFGNCRIVSRGGIVQQTGKVKGYALSWYNGKIQVALSDSTGKSISVYSKDNAPSDCVWHHIAFTWEQASREIAIYIDGKRQDSVVEGQSRAIIVEGQNKSIGLFSGSINSPEAPLIIGRMISHKENQEAYYKVAIAEVRLWNLARTQEQIKANISRRLNVKNPENKGLIGYWRLDDGGEDNKQVRNLASDNHYGTVYGAKWFPASPSISF